MKLFRALSSLIIASAAGSFAPLSSTAQPAVEPTPFILASGLDGPRGLRFGPDGYLYVAEAGTGGTNSTAGQRHRIASAPGALDGRTERSNFQNQLQRNADYRRRRISFNL